MGLSRQAAHTAAVGLMREGKAAEGDVPAPDLVVGSMTFFFGSIRGDPPMSANVRGACDVLLSPRAGTRSVRP